MDRIKTKERSVPPKVSGGYSTRQTRPRPLAVLTSLIMETLQQKHPREAERLSLEEQFESFLEYFIAALKTIPLLCRHNPQRSTKAEDPDLRDAKGNLSYEKPDNQDALPGHVHVLALSRKPSGAGPVVRCNAGGRRALPGSEMGRRPPRL